jgi:large repetitive protein
VNRRLGRACLAAGAGLLLAAAGFAVAFAASSKGLASVRPSSPANGKVQMCHYTGSGSNPFVTIVVSADSVPQHEAQGDTIGPCGSTTSSSTSSSTKSTTTKSTRSTTTTSSSTSTTSTTCCTTSTTSSSSSSTTSTTSEGADLSVEISNAPTSIVVQQGVTTYTVKVRNAGPEEADVFLSVTFPAELLPDEPDTEDCTLDGRTVTCHFSLGVDDSNDSAEVDITAHAQTTLGTFAVTAEVGSETFDPDPSNNTRSSSTTITCGLCVTKTASKAIALVGQNLTYTVGVRNAYHSLVTDVAIVDTLPTTVTFVKKGSSTGCSAVGRVVTCTVGDLSPGEGATRTIVVHLDGPPGAIVNSATATGTLESGEPADAVANVATVTTQVPETADLSITKTGPASVRPGDPVTYTLVVTNRGPSTTVDTIVEDELPAGTTFVSASTSRGTCTGGAVVVCDLGPLDVEHANKATIVIVVTSSCSPPIVNTAHVFDAGFTFEGTPLATGDPNPDNNTASVTTTPDCADVAVTKSVTPETATVGDTVTWVVGVTNNGPAPARRILLQDALPVEVSFESVTTTAGTCTGGGVVDCKFDTLAVGASATITITTRAASAGTATNIAVAPAVDDPAHGGSTDPNLANNSATATVVITAANLSITKTAAPTTVGLRDRLTYTITVTNHGPSDAKNTRITDDVPAGLAFVSVSTSAGTCTSGRHVVCDLGSVANGASATVEIVVEARAVGTQVNTATVTSTTHDGDRSNNSASATTHVTSANLSITKTESPNPATVGQPVVYTLTVANAGPSAAKDVRVVDPLPRGVSFVSAKPSQGRCVGGATVRCALGTIAAGAKATIAIRVIPRAAGTVKNVATVASSTQDPTKSNNDDGTTTTVTSADLSLQLRAEPDPVTVGHLLDYVVQIEDGGPTAASSVVVTFDLPEGATLVDRGPCTGDRVLTCDLGRLGLGGSSAFTITVRPLHAGPMTARAHVAGREFDRDSSNNEAIAEALARFLPSLAAVPPLGTPGFVTTAVGSGFPATTNVLLRWQPGLGSLLVRTDTEGRLRIPVLVLSKDASGPRRLVALSRAADPGFRFAPVTAPFLVVPGSLEPSGFVERR